MDQLGPRHNINVSVQFPHPTSQHLIILINTTANLTRKLLLHWDLLSVITRLSARCLQNHRILSIALHAGRPQSSHWWCSPAVFAYQRMLTRLSCWHLSLQPCLRKYKGRKREDSKGGKKPRVLPTDHRYCIRSVGTLVEKNEPCYIRSYLLAVLASQLVLQFQRHLKDFEILLCRLAGNIAQILFDRSVRYQCPPQICIRIALHHCISPPKPFHNHTMRSRPSKHTCYASYPEEIGPQHKQRIVSTEL